MKKSLIHAISEGRHVPRFSSWPSGHRVSFLRFANVPLRIVQPTVADLRISCLRIIHLWTAISWAVSAGASPEEFLTGHGARSRTERFDPLPSGKRTRAYSRFASVSSTSFTRASFLFDLTNFSRNTGPWRDSQAGNDFPFGKRHMNAKKRS